MAGTGREPIIDALVSVSGVSRDTAREVVSVPDTDDDAALFAALIAAWVAARKRGEVQPGETPPEWAERTGWGQ